MSAANVLLIVFILKYVSSILRQLFGLEVRIHISR